MDEARPNHLESLTVGPNGDLLVPMLKEPIRATLLTCAELKRKLEHAYRDARCLRRRSLL